MTIEILLNSKADLKRESKFSNYNPQSMSATVREQARALYTATYGEEPTVIVMAPGRVNLIGEHTDYQNGFVCPMALEKYTSIAASFTPTTTNTTAVTTTPSSSPCVRCTSKNFATGAFVVTDKMSPLAHDDPSSWMNYLMGVVHEYLPITKALQVSVDINLAIVSDVPFGSGLSSSAALETAMAKIMEAIIRLHSTKIGTWEPTKCSEADRTVVESALSKNLNGNVQLCTKVLHSLSNKINRVATTLRCQRAEHVFGGVQCGIMDQYVSSCATPNNAIMIDCLTLESFTVPMPNEVAIIVTKTNVKHSLGDSAYNKRVDECNQAVAVLNAASHHANSETKKKYSTLRDVETLKELENAFQNNGHDANVVVEEAVYRRARHVVSENQRVAQFRTAMIAGNFEAAGKCMYESHTSLKDDYEVSCIELDALVVIAQKLGMKAGVYGARMTGGGFGGCTVTMVRADRAAELCAQIESAYIQMYPEKKPLGQNTDGTRERLGFVTKAGRGANILVPEIMTNGYYSSGGAGAVAQTKKKERLNAREVFVGVAAVGVAVAAIFWLAYR